MIGIKQQTPGTLAENEPHPAAFDAKEYLRSIADRLSLYQESFASCSIGGNRMAEVCSETLRRLLSGQPVSDRYLLGLAWVVKCAEEIKIDRTDLAHHATHERS